MANHRYGAAATLFYRQVEALDPAQHANLRLMRDHTYYFSRECHIVPVTVVEFAEAARHYPILFSGDETAMPVVLVGIEHGSNLFVKQDGHWREGCYIPAYLRRYPFILLRDNNKDGEVSLFLDRATRLLSEEADIPLFEDGQPTQIIEKVAGFAAQYSKETARTRAFVDACQEEDILIDRTAKLSLAEGKAVQVQGFRVIDENRLHNLSDEAVIKWWRNGWLPLAMSHIMSLGNFGRLFYHLKNDS